MRIQLGDKYRWLAVGDRVRYVGREGRAELRDQLGYVRAVPDYGGVIGNCSVILDDGLIVVAPVGVWRRLSVHA